ncbi:MAG: DUF72 domain-containing protein [Rhizobiales bacterium]|nr:DUF72 domain-containing protein [Hyphomicrobiales bacterium]
MIRIGIGGWTYPPWRGVFYPPGLTQARELEHASRQLTSIEINGTFYGSQKPESFRRWVAETPDDFVFSVKGPRFTTHRRVLAEAGESVERFFAGGVRELGKKLGPVLWQFAPTKKFDPEDFAAFLALLPKDVRHAVEVRHDSFVTPDFVATARKAGVAIAFVESDKHPPIDEATADFTYARLEKTKADIETGYTEPELRAWAKRAREWETKGKRDVFIYMISGAKERAPAAAVALIGELGK